AQRMFLSFRHSVGGRMPGKRPLPSNRHMTLTGGGGNFRSSAFKPVWIVATTTTSKARRTAPREVEHWANCRIHAIRRFLVVRSGSAVEYRSKAGPRQESQWCRAEPRTVSREVF